MVSCERDWREHAATPAMFPSHGPLMHACLNVYTMSLIQFLNYGFGPSLI
ncbi:hypothetical protein ZOSMA_95G00440 [Zostera marina]|uniref:Uncharacterized protein n=1 Tax=Zostera marina TaxID=29655 RepID=A0A0K9NI64_ZOSMR|nr:hypothetical protein ZOSMA_95G00440 [Zostera marina]